MWNAEELRSWFQEFQDEHGLNLAGPQAARAVEAIEAHADEDPEKVRAWVVHLWRKAKKEAKLPGSFFVGCLERGEPEEIEEEEPKNTPCRGTYLHGRERRPREGKQSRGHPKAESWLDGKHIPPQQYEAYPGARPYLDEALERGGERAWYAVWRDWQIQMCPPPDRYQPSWDFDAWLKAGAYAAQDGKVLWEVNEPTVEVEELLHKLLPSTFPAPERPF